MRFNPDEYVGVNERIEKFYAKYPGGRILTSVLEHNAETGFVLVRAEVYRETDDALPAATGHAYETRGGGHVQQGSYVEVCETSAVGRAIQMLGFDVKRRQNGHGSRDGAREARRAEPQQGGTEAPPAEKRPKVSLEELHKRIHTWRGKIKTAGFMTFTSLDGMLTTYGRKKVEDLTHEQALQHGKELKEYYESEVQRRAEETAEGTGK